MTSINAILNFIIFLSLIVIFSNCQVLGWWEYLQNLKGRICNENQENPSENLAFLPEGMDAIKDVLPEICQHLNMMDLCTLRSVCKTLRETVDRETAKRGFEVNRVPITRRLEITPSEPLQKTLKIKPRFVLFFTTQKKPTWIFYDASLKELMAQYLPETPKDCILLHIIGSMVKINSTDIDEDTNQALALFFQETDRMKIRYAGLDFLRMGNIFDSFNPENKLLQDSFPENWDSSGAPFDNFAYIVFNLKLPDSEASYGTNILNKLIQMYQKNPNKFALWGGSISSMDSSTFTTHFTLNFGASISGSGVKAWSLVIDTDTAETLIEKKIRDFKKFIHLRSKKTIALLMITSLSCSTESASITSEKFSNKLNLFSRIFPDITIITYGINKKEPKYCIDSWIRLEANVAPKLQYEDNFVCFLIISYL